MSSISVSPEEDLLTSVFTSIDKVELFVEYTVSVTQFAEILSKLRTSGLTSTGDKQIPFDIPGKGRNGYLLTDHLPPIKMTKVYHRLREVQKLQPKIHMFELRFGKVNQWATGIMDFWFTQTGGICFVIQQFAETDTDRSN